MDDFSRLWRALHLHPVPPRDKRVAEHLLGLATRLEALLRQQALTPDLAVTFQHEDLLHPKDLTRLFPARRQLTFDRRALLASYAELCGQQCTSDRVIAINVTRAEHLLDALGDLSAIHQDGIEAWQNARFIQVARKSAVEWRPGDACPRAVRRPLRETFA